MKLQNAHGGLDDTVGTVVRHEIVEFTLVEVEVLEPFVLLHVLLDAVGRLGVRVENAHHGVEVVDGGEVDVVGVGEEGEHIHDIEH